MPHKDDTNYHRTRYGVPGLDALTDTYLDLFTVSAIDYYFSDVLKDAARRRIQNNNKRWRYYEGKHYDEMQFDGDTKLVVPYIKTMVDFGVDFLFGMGEEEPWLTKAPDGNEALAQIVEQVWNDNDRPSIAYEMGQMGSVTGDLFTQVTRETHDENFKDLPPDDQRTRIIPLDSSFVFPEWSAFDRNKMKACLIQYPIFQEHFDPITQKTTRVKKVFSQYITDTEIVEYVDNEEVKRMPNLFGEVNVVHIKNLPRSGSSFGQSDVDSLIALNMELDEVSENISATIGYHVEPVTIIYGARAATMEKGANKVWSGLPKDARIENLGLSSDLSQAHAHAEKIKLYMHETSGIPENALGQFQPISNTTGVALHMLYLPLVLRTKRKRRMYHSGLQRINRLILKSEQIYGGLDIYKFAGDPANVYQTFVKWPSILPKDEMVQMQLLTQKLQAGLESVEGALDDLGIEDVQKKVEEIIKSRLMWADVSALEAENSAPTPEVPENTENPSNEGLGQTQEPPQQNA